MEIQYLKILWNQIPLIFAHLSATQWAFLSGRSTVTALLSVTQDLFTTLESGKEICVIFFDYQNAFDSIPHAAKLTDIQFSLQWLIDYLTNRKQFVVANAWSRVLYFLVSLKGLYLDIFSSS